jgi:hypothetical protein
MSHLIYQQQKFFYAMGSCILPVRLNKEGCNMGTTQDKTTKDHNDEVRLTGIDRTAPAGSENSLGAQSVRDGRPGSDDGVVEAIDEEGPGTSAQPVTGKNSESKK